MGSSFSLPLDACALGNLQFPVGYISRFISHYPLGKFPICFHFVLYLKVDSSIYIMQLSRMITCMFNVLYCSHMNLCVSSFESQDADELQSSVQICGWSCAQNERNTNYRLELCLMQSCRRIFNVIKSVLTSFSPYIYKKKYKVS